jgi:NADH-quinone oxidoreductase subunit L
MSRFVSKDNSVYKLLYNRYYQNEIFTQLFAVKFVYEGLAMAGYHIDRFIDGIVNVISYLIIEAGDSFRKVQTGVIQHYSVAVITGVSLLVILIKLVMEVF